MFVEQVESAWREPMYVNTCKSSPAGGEHTELSSGQPVLGDVVARYTRHGGRIREGVVPPGGGKLG